jgi:hypothetical protein
VHRELVTDLERLTSFPLSDSKVSPACGGPAMRDRWCRGERGWPASFPVAQLPNAPLSVALGGLLVTVVTDGSVHAYARAVFYAGLAAWAWEELVGGVNWVRRTIGAAGLVYVVVQVGAAVAG